MLKEKVKENLKIALMIIGLFAAVATPITIAAIIIWSNTVSVTVSDYTLTISDPSDGTIYDTYTFTGTLTLGGNPVSGETVTLWMDDGTGWVETTDTDTTAADGSYSITWTPTTSGTYDFKTRVAI